MGDINIKVGRDLSGTVVVGDYIVKDSYNSIEQRNTDLAHAIQNISEHLSSNYSQHAEAEEIKDNFKELQEKIADDESPSRIKRVWRSLIELAPTVSSIAGVVPAITALFDSK
ncbi:hypothetical protein ORJ66_08480 [Pseudoalteromonas tunicata]|uniref:hypothetical protein n=1 Tax=Pseudoalteromonas tunicata TaxID=314281 RepID=UPI00273F5ABD|nr:hypothetical protein [Pseudoalteromonas tunicata]MDP5213076.1 hypothetical protein [Pseudoalteromonas tunicata]